MLTIALIATTATVTTFIAPAVVLKWMLSRYWNEPTDACVATDDAPLALGHVSHT
jgi:hypothetical protein